MRRTLLLFLLLCALALTGCDLFVPLGEATASPHATELPKTTVLPDTDPVPTESLPTERETETDTPETEYFPNETDDSHTKRY